MSFIGNFPKDLKNTNLTDYSSIDSKQTNITDERQKSNRNKTVCFNGVEIIDVESYKEYYQINELKLESTEKNMNDCRVCNCTIL